MCSVTYMVVQYLRGLPVTPIDHKDYTWIYRISNCLSSCIRLVLNKFKELLFEHVCSWGLGCFRAPQRLGSCNSKLSFAQPAPFVPLVKEAHMHGFEFQPIAGSRRGKFSPPGRKDIFGAVAMHQQVSMVDQDQSLYLRCQ